MTSRSSLVDDLRALLRRRAVAGALGLGGSDAVLTLDLRGVARSGRVLYRTREYHRPGALGYGFVRIVRS